MCPWYIHKSPGLHLGPISRMARLDDMWILSISIKFPSMKRHHMSATKSFAGEQSPSQSHRKSLPNFGCLHQDSSIYVHGGCGKASLFCFCPQPGAWGHVWFAIRIRMAWDENWNDRILEAFSYWLRIIC